MPSPAFGPALRTLRDGADIDVHRSLAAALAPLGARDPVVYLADFSHRTLIPVALLRQQHAEPPGEEDVATTMAGRAFTQLTPVTAEREDGHRVWVPIREGSRRAGVLAVTVSQVGPATLEDLETVGVLVGLALAAASPLSDIPHLRRNGHGMSLAATMQWGLMPPLSAVTERASIAGVLEPAYDIAGDGFDYAINGDLVEFAILDGMGHGIASSMLTGLAIGAYRHARRQHLSVPDMHAAVEDAIAAQYDGDAFATGIIGRLSTSTGELDWSCAGHPSPLLLRGRKVIAELECTQGLPYGLGDPTPELGTCSLEPGDTVLLYTDGVIEARTPSGEEFGLERLRDLLEREAASSSPGEELLRRLVRAVIDHQVTELRDDATLMLVQWFGADAEQLGPLPEQRPHAQESALAP